MKAILVAGLLFGDEGKGATVDFLCRQNPDTSLVVRYGGGPQCAHTVVCDDGTWHTFSQFGSGTFAGIRTHLSQYMVIRPDWLVEEAVELSAKGVHDPLSMISVHENSLISTIYHQEASNKAAKEHRRGTTGVGVGVTRRLAKQDDYWMAIRVKDCFSLNPLASKLRQIRTAIAPDSKNDHVDVARDIMRCMGSIRVWGNTLWDIRREEGTVVFEGHQGALLDKTFGYRPYVTSDDTTFIGADALLGGYEGEREYYGVMRSYMTRHGDGPLVTETPRLDVLPEPHNADKAPEFQGKFRRGFIDFDEIKKGIRILHEPYLKLVITHMDSIPLIENLGLPYKTNEALFWNKIPKTDTDHGLEFILGKPVSILGYGPSAKDYKWNT